jgi:hypothetical protein
MQFHPLFFDTFYKKHFFCQNDQLAHLCFNGARIDIRVRVSVTSWVRIRVRVRVTVRVRAC